MIEGQALATIAPNLVEGGDFVAALEAIEEAVAVAEDVQDANLLMRAWTNFTYVVTNGAASSERPRQHSTPCTRPHRGACSASAPPDTTAPKLS